MGVVKLISHILTAWVAFWHPCFASYKALSHRPLSEPELERWVKYWAVLAALVGTEYALEWLVSWIPFYWEAKTFFILYLALPQTQGSTFIYDTYLAPYFARNEDSISDGIITAQSNLVVFLRAQLLVASEYIMNFVRKVQASQAAQPGGDNNQQPSTGSPADVVANLWRTYGSSVMTGFARISGQAPAPAAPQNAGSPAPQGSASAPGPQPHSRTPYVGDSE